MVFKWLHIILLVILPHLLVGQIYQFTKLERFGIAVNSSAEESNPVLSADGKSLYMVRTYDVKNTGGIYDQDVWVSTYKDGMWSKPQPFELGNNKLHNAVIGECIDSLRNKTLYLLSTSTVDKDFTKGISKAEKGSGDSLWNLKGKVSIPELNIEGKYVGYHISEDQKAIILSYEGSNSEGEEDLYYSLWQNGSWSEPEHMGAAINSPGFEMSPFLSPNKDTIYFSSNGFKGLGDADIYYSVRKNKWNSWSKPINLGKSINTPYFDAYFSLRQGKALWSSNREGNDLDIWTASNLPPPVFKVTVKELRQVSEFQGSDGKISIAITSGIPPYKFQWSNGQTTAEIIDLIKGEYKLTIVDSIGRKHQETFNIIEPEAKQEDLIRFPNLQYEYGKWSLTNDSLNQSYDSLKLVAKLLTDYPNLIIELISHTDSRGEENINQIISENRAKACYVYLVEEENIDPRRIIPLGKGESDPAEWFDPEQNAFVKLTEVFIQSKKDNLVLFEELNQINRRTEGRVLSLDFDPKTAPEAPKKYMEFQSLPK